MTNRVAKRARRTASAALVAGGLLLAIQAPAAPAACPNEAERQRQGATHLPGCRAYEMVTPPEKNGGEPIAFASRMSVAEDGSAIVFDSLTPFGDAIGTGTDVDYMAVRGPGGWATHALTPYQTPPSYTEAVVARQPLFPGPYTPDLSKGIFKSRSPVLSAPEDHANVAHVENLYLASDLRTPGGARFNLLSDAHQPVPTLSGERYPWPVAATEDLGTVLFESFYRLTADAPPGTANRKLYKWSAAAGLRPLTQVPPGGERSCGDGGPTCVSAASSVSGPGAASWMHMFNTLSADGSRVFLTVVRGSSVWGESSVAGDLYRRDDRGTAPEADDETVKLNASERAPADAFEPAFFWYASVDGERAAFSSAEALTEDAPDDGTQKLYLWSATAGEAGEHLTLLSADTEPADGNRDFGGAIGGSEDGRTIYFFNKGQLVAGQPPLPQGDGNNRFGIYRWREGEGLRFLGRTINPDDVFYAVNRSMKLPSLNIHSRVSADGEKLLLSLRQPPVEGLSYDHSEACGGTVGNGGGNPSRGCQQLYLFDVGGGEPPVCVSCLSGGSPSDERSFFGTPEGEGNSYEVPILRPALLNNPVDEDFSRIFFTSGLALDPRDTNGRLDVYAYDVESGEAALLSSGESKRDSLFMNATPDGSSVFLLTNERLLGWDVDAGRDLYTARVGGGLPEPPQPVPSCEGDACQPSASVPDVPTPASAGFRASPPQAVAARCAPLARRAVRLLRRARALRGKAGKTVQPHVARRVRRTARRLDRRAKRIGKRGRLCRARGGRR